MSFIQIMFYSKKSRPIVDTTAPENMKRKYINKNIYIQLLTTWIRWGYAMENKRSFNNRYMGRNKMKSHHIFSISHYMNQMRFCNKGAKDKILPPSNLETSVSKDGIKKGPSLIQLIWSMTNISQLNYPPEQMSQTKAAIVA